MPTYDYQCKDCEHTLEVFQSFSEKTLTECPKCHKNELQRIISGGFGFSIKGGTSSTNNSQAASMGGRYIPMDSTEQKFENRMKELMGNGEI